MKFLLISISFILTTSVMAQASESTNLKWITQYSTSTQVNGLPVKANLDEAQIYGGTPLEIVGDASSDFPVVARQFRLVLVVSESPLVKMVYRVQPRTISIQGQPRLAYESDPADTHQLHFLITPGQNGALQVDYSQTGEAGDLNAGTFSLSPVPHIL